MTLVLNNEDQEKTGGKVDGGKGREGDTRRGGEEVGKEGVHNREENSFLPGRIMVLYHLFSRSPGLCSCCQREGRRLHGGASLFKGATPGFQI